MLATPDLSRKLAAEFLGTAALVCTVIGSGIMADALSSDDAVSLLGNTMATAAMLFVLISLLGPISGAHFNPAVSLVFTLLRQLSPGLALVYTAAQVSGGLVGTLAAHAMFDLPLFEISSKARQGSSQSFSELVASFGLIVTILGGLRMRPQAVPAFVALYITAAYWFTASTSFANPAVAIARAFTDTFAGIRPSDVPAFILAELVGAGLAMLLAGWLFAPKDAA
ncbi:glycerol uptake transporter protein [Cypionkella aquatica]|uniref:Glycerol uptake transporter protein n=1 Tax=Cypionkella aquatica TaxID=1756042 RepID=A0AA37WZH1_9RHOB|nr:glycerol uptake transporter protein [Cypionkella aquatica]